MLSLDANNFAFKTLLLLASSERTVPFLFRCSLLKKWNSGIKHGTVMQKTEQ